MINPNAIRNLLDNQLRFTEPGLKTYLRLKTTTIAGSTEFEEYGFHTINPLADIFDIEIEPPASVHAMSLHNIGMNSTTLNFGAHEFDISHTFVERMMDTFGVSNGYKVWGHPRVIGLFYNGNLFSIESQVPKAFGNEVIRWILIGNQLGEGE